MDSKITLPGVTFNIFTATDETTGEDQICCVVPTEQDYYKLQREAQKRGKQVDEYLYAEMLPVLKANGYNTPPDCFSVTVGVPPEPGEPIAPYAPRRSLQ
jgi:hypothetical protein